MYNVRHPKIHLSRVLDYDIKNKTYIITDDMIFDSEEELIDFLARYHYPKYNFAGNEIPGAYNNKYMDCQALTGYSRNSHLYDLVMNKPLKPSNCKEINYDWILYSYIGLLYTSFFTTTLFCSLYFFNFRFSPLLFLCILYYNTSDFLIFVPCIYLLC